MRSIVLFLSISLVLLCACTPQSEDISYLKPAMNPPVNEPIAPAKTDVELLSGMHTVILNTSLGNITIKMDADKAPLAVTNFVTHAQNGYYDGMVFHRIIKDFMIQGGDPNGNGTGGESIWGEPFADEQSGIPLVRGTLAMANSGPGTNGSQFFIVHADATPWLDGKHTAFGTVTEGMDILDTIANVETGAGDRPVKEVTFSVDVVE